jgi:hypothetical protein
VATAKPTIVEVSRIVAGVGACNQPWPTELRTAGIGCHIASLSACC